MIALLTLLVGVALLMLGNIFNWKKQEQGCSANPHLKSLQNSACFCLILGGILLLMDFLIYFGWETFYKNSLRSGLVLLAGATWIISGFFLSIDRTPDILRKLKAQTDPGIADIIIIIGKVIFWGPLARRLLT